MLFVLRVLGLSEVLVSKGLDGGVSFLHLLSCFKLVFDLLKLLLRLFNRKILFNWLLRFFNFLLFLWLLFK